MPETKSTIDELTELVNTIGEEGAATDSLLKGAFDALSKAVTLLKGQKAAAEDDGGDGGEDGGGDGGGDGEEDPTDDGDEVGYQDLGKGATGEQYVDVTALFTQITAGLRTIAQVHELQKGMNVRLQRLEKASIEGSIAVVSTVAPLSKAVLDLREDLRNIPEPVVDMRTSRRAGRDRLPPAPVPPKDIDRVQLTKARMADIISDFQVSLYQRTSRFAEADEDHERIANAVRAA